MMSSFWGSAEKELMMDARTKKGKWSLFITICNLDRFQMDNSHRANGYIRES